jgi:acyl carrier protein
MSSEEMKQELAKFIAEGIVNQPKRVIGENDPLISSGLIPSFNLVDLSIFVEDKYGVRIDDTELNQDTFDTINQLTALIESRM